MLGINNPVSIPKPTSIPQTTSHGHEGAAVLGAENKVNHVDVSKAERKPAEQTNEMSQIEEEGAVLLEDVPLK